MNKMEEELQLFTSLARHTPSSDRQPTDVFIFIFVFSIKEH